MECAAQKFRCTVERAAEFVMRVSRKNCCSALWELRKCSLNRARSSAKKLIAIAASTWSPDKHKQTPRCR